MQNKWSKCAYSPKCFMPIFSLLIFYAEFYPYSMREKRSILSYSGPHFPAFGLNTERYEASLRIQSECGKTRNRITPNTDTFYAVQIAKVMRKSLKTLKVSKHYGHDCSMCKSWGSQFFRTTTGIQSEPDAFENSKLVMTFLTSLGVT